MAGYFNLTCFQDARNFVQIGVCNNAITNGAFGNSLLLIVFCISIITMLYAGVKNSFVASMWITTVTSILLSIMGWVVLDIVLLLTVITALATLMMFRTREN